MAPVILAQQNIGSYNIIVVFLATDWTVILEKLRVDYLQARSEMLVAFLWDDICKPIWKARCNIKHDTKNFSTLDEMSLLADTLVWYH